MILSCLHHARTGSPLLRQSCIRADHSCSFARCFNSALVILTPPQYNSSGTFRNVPLLLSHACPCAGWFDGYNLGVRFPLKSTDYLLPYKKRPAVYSAGRENFIFFTVLLTGSSSTEPLRLLWYSEIALHEAPQHRRDLRAGGAARSMRSWSRTPPRSIPMTSI